MTQKKILVTGADGFIGSHLVESLIKKGFSVKAFALYNSFNSLGWLDSLDDTLKAQIEIFTGDIRDPYGVKKACQGCNQILHLAALIGIPYSYHSPDTYVDTNIKGTLNILQAAKELNLERTIVTSTSEVYGTAQYIPIDENHPLQPQSPYSATKIAADQLALSFYNSFELPVAIVRPFNTYGPRQSARAVIPTIITQLANNINDIKLGSLTPTRDFNYVQDTVNGMIAMLNADSKILGEVVNIGSNFELSIGDLAINIAKLMNKEINIITDEQRLRPKNSEVERLYAANAKALSLLDWEPQYSGLKGFEKGLQKTINWFSNPANLKRYKADSYNI